MCRYLQLGSGLVPVSRLSRDLPLHNARGARRALAHIKPEMEHHTVDPERNRFPWCRRGRRWSASRFWNSSSVPWGNPPGGVTPFGTAGQPPLLAIHRPPRFWLSALAWSTKSHGHVPSGLVPPPPLLFSPSLLLIRSLPLQPLHTPAGPWTTVVHCPRVWGSAPVSCRPPPSYWLLLNPSQIPSVYLFYL